MCCLLCVVCCVLFVVVCCLLSVVWCLLFFAVCCLLCVEDRTLLVEYDKQLLGQRKDPTSPKPCNIMYDSPQLESLKTKSSKFTLETDGTKKSREAKEELHYKMMDHQKALDQRVLVLSIGKMKKEIASHTFRETCKENLGITTESFSDSDIPMPDDFFPNIGAVPIARETFKQIMDFAQGKP